jgi:lipoprotein-anchoring transpeptidase ErfK/SrfK
MPKDWLLVSIAFLVSLSSNAATARDLPTKISAAVTYGHAAKPSIKSAKHSEKTKEAAAASGEAKEEANQAAFTNNHYVLTGSLPVNGYHKGAPVVVVVDKGSHSTYVLQLQGDHVARVLTVSNTIGSADKPTPPGRYTVLKKEMYPLWIPPVTIDPEQKPVQPYNLTHKNPLGVAAIYLDKFEIDLHGTNEPKLIRKSASHGCVRHSNADILRLFSMVNKGDVVYIVNKFRGKVLNKADFVRPNHVAETGGTTEPPTTQNADKSPAEQKSRNSRSVSVYWYTVDT